MILHIYTIYLHINLYKYNSQLSQPAISLESLPGSFLESCKPKISSGSTNSFGSATKHACQTAEERPFEKNTGQEKMVLGINASVHITE